MPPTPPTSVQADAKAQPLNSTTVGESSLAETLLVLRKRKWILIAALAIGVTLGFYRAATQPTVYVATGKIEVRSGTANQYRVDTVGSTLDPVSHLQTEVTILQSDSLAIQIAREMDLPNNPYFLGHKPTTPHLSMDIPAVREAIVQTLHGSLRVAPVERTDVITLSYASSNPQFSADLLNHLINGYIQRSYQTRFASTQRVSQWLSGQLDDLKRQVETSQEQLIDLQKQLGVLGLGFDSSKTGTETTNQLDALSHANIEARIRRILAESRYRTLSKADPNALESGIDAVPGSAPSELNRMRSEMAEDKAKLAQQGVLIADNNPSIKGLRAHIAELQREINAEQNRLVEQARQAYIAAQADEQQTGVALENTKNDAYRVRDDLVEYTLRQREYESNRALYEGLLSRLRAAGIQAGLESSEIDIVDQALPPANQTRTPRSSIVVITTIFCLIGGVIIAFLLESLDTGVRSVAELEAITQLPSLAVVPRTRKSGDRGGQSVAAMNLGVLSTSKSQFSEAFRALRTSLLLATTGHPPKIIMVSSSTPSEGKTTIATNLACIMAQRETRVLLIDSDLRRPSVHHRFGLTAKSGLSTYLAGVTTFEESIQHIPDVPNLDILTSGPVPPFPTEMLSSQSMRDLLTHCSGIYTHIVLDTPPVLSVTDGVVLARLADAIVFVVRQSKTSRHVVRRGRELLARSGGAVSGFVMNAVDLNSPEYYGYYGYSGYAYSNGDGEEWDTNAKPRQERSSKEQQG